jgi:hypothetical protein
MRYGGIRGLGFTSTTTYGLSVLFSMGAILLVFVSKYRRFIKQDWFFLLSFNCVLVGIMFSGRTGWFGIGLAVLMYFYLNGFNDYLSTIKTKFSRLAISLSVLVLFVIFFVNPSIIKTINNFLLPFAFELFINFFSQGDLTASSFEYTQKMYYQVSPSTFFLGDARWDALPGKLYQYYGQTDAGYMRHMLFYGAIGSLILYTMYIFLFKYMYRIGKKVFGKPYAVLSVVLCIYFFVAHWKGDFLNGSNMNIKFLFLLLNYTIVSVYGLNNIRREL